MCHEMPLICQNLNDRKDYVQSVLEKNIAIKMTERMRFRKSNKKRKFLLAFKFYVFLHYRNV